MITPAISEIETAMTTMTDSFALNGLRLINLPAPGGSFQTTSALRHNPAYVTSKTQAKRDIPFVAPGLEVHE